MRGMFLGEMLLIQWVSQSKWWGRKRLTYKYAALGQPDVSINILGSQLKQSKTSLAKQIFAFLQASCKSNMKTDTVNDHYDRIMLQVLLSRWQTWEATDEPLGKSVTGAFIMISNCGLLLHYGALAKCFKSYRPDQSFRQFLSVCIFEPTAACYLPYNKCFLWTDNKNDLKYYLKSKLFKVIFIMELM